MVKQVTKIVIPIAGHGTRMFPASKIVPKALFPIFDPADGLCKPILLYVLQQVLLAYEENERKHVSFCIILSPFQKPLITQFFSEEPNDYIYEQKPELKPQLESVRELSKRVTFCVQEKQEGFGHAILCAKDFIANEPFVILLGDHVFKSYTNVNCLRQVLQVHEQKQTSCLGVALCKESEVKLYGIMKAKIEALNESTLGGKISTIYEKPSVELASAELRLQYDELHLIKNQLPEYSNDEFKYMKVFGIYCFDRKILDILQQNYEEKKLTLNELQLTDAMKRMSELDGLYAVVIQGKTYDTGIPSAYTDTMLCYGNK